MSSSHTSRCSRPTYVNCSQCCASASQTGRSRRRTSGPRSICSTELQSAQSNDENADKPATKPISQGDGIRYTGNPSRSTSTHAKLTPSHYRHIRHQPASPSRTATPSSRTTTVIAHLCRRSGTLCPSGGRNSIRLQRQSGHHGKREMDIKWLGMFVLQDAAKVGVPTAGAPALFCAPGCHQHASCL